VILYPAIDLRDGGAVRLTQGDFEREKRYGDPLDLAATFMQGGASFIHVVDLNAARTGVPHERETLGRIAELAASAGVRVQTGGGIRSEEDVEAVLHLGVARVVLGTTALRDPDLTTRCIRRWPGRVAVGIDYSGADLSVGQAQSHGWEVGSSLAIPAVLAQWEDEPLGAVIATSIARDGMLEGPDLSGLRTLLSLTPHPVIASGGVGSLVDVRALAALSVEGGRRLEGAIVGKALVEGRFSVEEAVAACAVSA
jgi:phosphoribosylformimino-5-aminoimidazole carboxamide ribotide isomerase